MKDKKIKKLEPFNADDITIENWGGIQKYIKRPAVFHAIQLNCPEGFKITTKDGIIYGKAGDYLVFYDNEKYICSKEFFENTYILIWEV